MNNSELMNEMSTTKTREQGGRKHHGRRVSRGEAGRNGRASGDFLPNSDLSSPKKELLGLELIEILTLMIVALQYCMHQNLLLVGQIPL